QVLASKGLLAKLVFPLAVIFVFMVLAGQYESWSLPAAILLIVPMCILAAIAGVWVVGLDINIFTQIGLVVLIGLAAKNAILVVEFAKQLEDEGKERLEAIVEACRTRLRPILMTSFAFILGVVPLMTAKGAGAEMRFSLGVAVFSGMLGVTGFGLILTPVSAHRRGLPPVACARLGANVPLYAALWALNLLRIARHRDAVVRDFLHHGRCVGYFTAVAATCVLGSQCVIVLGAPGPASVLW